MTHNEKHPARDRRAFPELFALHNTCADCNASDASAFAFRAWKRWRMAVSEAHELGIAPWPMAAANARAIRSEWFVDEGRPE